jgi:hypothetical protein
MKNVYRTNPVKYASWKTARHVKRQPISKDAGTPPPTP